jgi:hypothetical protein
MSDWDVFLLESRGLAGSSCSHLAMQKARTARHNKNTALNGRRFAKVERKTRLPFQPTAERKDALN